MCSEQQKSYHTVAVKRPSRNGVNMTGMHVETEKAAAGEDASACVRPTRITRRTSMPAGRYSEGSCPALHGPKYAPRVLCGARHAVVFDGCD